MEEKVLEFENAVKNLFETEGVKFDDISTELSFGTTITVNDEFDGEEYDLEIPDEITTTVIINEVLTMDFFDKLSRLQDEFVGKYNNSIYFYVNPTTENL